MTEGATDATDAIVKRLVLARRARALTWVLSPDFAAHWSTTIAPTLPVVEGESPKGRAGRAKLSQARRVVLALLAWYVDPTDPMEQSAPPIDSFLASRSGLSKTAIKDALRWYRELGFGGHAKAKRPLRAVLEAIAATFKPIAGGWTNVGIVALEKEVAALEAPPLPRRGTLRANHLQGQREELERRRTSLARLNALTGTLANTSSNARGAEFLARARDVAAWTTEVMPLLPAKHTPPELGPLLGELRDVLADFETGNGVEPRRKGAPTYHASQLRPPLTWQGSAACAYAWAHGLDLPGERLSDRARLVLHAILSWTASRKHGGQTWRADRVLATVVGISPATWERALPELHARGLVHTRTVPKGARLPNGERAKNWTTVHRVAWDLLKRLASPDTTAETDDPEAPEETGSPPPAPLGGVGSEGGGGRIRGSEGSDLREGGVGSEGRISRSDHPKDHQIDRQTRAPARGAVGGHQPTQSKSAESETESGRRSVFAPVVRLAASGERRR